MAYSLFELSELCGRQVTSASLRAITLGFALPLIAESRGQQCQSLSWHADRLLAGIATDQVALTFDRFGQLCGFVQWAHTSSAVSNHLLRHGADALLSEAMISGSQTWIIDFCAMHGELKQVLADLRDQWLSAATNATYFRTKRRCRIGKRVSRSDKTSFFVKPYRPPSENRQFLKTPEGELFLCSALNALDAAMELGEVLQLVKQMPSIGGLPLLLALTRLRIPMRLLQYKLYRNQVGALSGFLSWAWLDAHGVRVHAEPHQLAAYQWNEGGTPVLQDAFASSECLASVANDLKNGLIPEESIGIRSENMQDSLGSPYYFASEDAATLCSLAAEIHQPIDIIQHLSKACKRGAQ